MNAGEVEAAANEPAAQASQIDSLLSDLKAISAEASESAEDIVAAHPFAAVAAAFLLGLLAGWTMGRNS